MGGPNGINSFFYRSAGNWLGRAAGTPMDVFMTNGQAYPNPCTERLNLTYEASRSCDASLYCFDGLGRLVFESFLKVVEGHNRVEVDFSKYPSGIYWLSSPEIGLVPVSVFKE